eukprot:CAMPEP_0172318506 /NCGR_PEP_ID=MMETSP1058-20130122/35088_1 /TAXON_ID=83371 /ORGANISM="Detonula confervacea, Strain CCMP 353" /LENGTH=49 /DNA_ID=CAMNT_0013033355 /DNA_START=290 /DNA_END=439 /DNA_ORIENTATION=-
MAVEDDGGGVRRNDDEGGIGPRYGRRSSVKAADDIWFTGRISRDRRRIA